jgi:hypothetical protein
MRLPVVFHRNHRWGEQQLACFPGSPWYMCVEYVRMCVVCFFVNILHLFTFSGPCSPCRCVPGPVRADTFKFLPLRGLLVLGGRHSVDCWLW